MPTALPSDPGNDRNKILLVKGVAGLGNRIECLLTAMLYARLSGRKLVVDWTDAEYSKDGTNVFHRFFRSPLCDPSDIVPASDSVYPGIWRGRLHESAWNMRALFGKVNDRQTWRNFSMDLSRLEYSEDVLVLWTYKEQIDLLRPHIQANLKPFGQLSNEDILKTLLRENLGLQPEIRERFDHFKSLHFLTPTIGVHVRYSDYRTNLWGALQKLNSLLEAVPGARIFFSTDNDRVKRMVEKYYPTAVSTPHWYPPMPGLAIHTHQKRPSPIESGVEALVDLYLLAECTHLVIDTSSSFSYVATLLTSAPESNIFDVAVTTRRKGPSLQRRIVHALMLGTGMYSWGFGMHVNLTRAMGVWRPPPKRPRP